MATNVVINNQPRQSPTVISVQSNQWSTGICDCFDDLEICCFASWCLPCFACKTASDFGECFCLPLLDMVFLAFQMLLCPTCIPPVSMSMRVAVRHHYKIQGDMCGDCVYTTFCNICSWCQMAREIKRHKQKFCICLVLVRLSESCDGLGKTIRGVGVVILKNKELSSESSPAQ
uniref:Plac8 onzin related protein 2 n=1 Tax=Anabas testudineus TaxID=64144 RepID=A0AAQ6ISN8_ANATE